MTDIGISSQTLASFVTEALRVGQRLNDASNNLSTYLPEDWSVLRSDLRAASELLRKASGAIRATLNISELLEKDTPVLVSRSDLRHWANQSELGKPVWRDIDAVLLGKRNV